MTLYLSYLAACLLELAGNEEALVSLVRKELLRIKGAVMMKNHRYRRYNLNSESVKHESKKVYEQEPSSSDDDDNDEEEYNPKNVKVEIKDSQHAQDSADDDSRSKKLLEMRHKLMESQKLLLQRKQDGTMEKTGLFKPTIQSLPQQKTGWTQKKKREASDTKSDDDQDANGEIDFTDCIQLISF